MRDEYRNTLQFRAMNDFGQCVPFRRLLDSKTGRSKLAIQRFATTLAELLYQANEVLQSHKRKQQTEVMADKSKSILGGSPYLILLPGDPRAFECSECSQIFLPESGETTANLAEDFINHTRVRHPSRYVSPNAVRVVAPPAQE